MIQVGNALFDELVHILSLAGFPPPCIALAVTERIDPAMLFGCEVLVLAAGAYNQINAMQARWAQRLLIGKAGTTSLRAPIAVAQVGWTPLATKAKEHAIMSLARVQLLPPGHPTAILVQLALDFDDSTWVATSSKYALNLTYLH